MNKCIIQFSVCDMESLLNSIAVRHQSVQSLSAVKRWQHPRGRMQDSLSLGGVPGDARELGGWRAVCTQICTWKGSKCDETDCLYFQRNIFFSLDYRVWMARFETTDVGETSIKCSLPAFISR